MSGIGKYSMGTESQHGEGSRKKKSWTEFFGLGEVVGYFFRKKDPNRPRNINLKMMHGVNKISIIVFLIGVLYLVFKHVIKPYLN
jgi:hypothetical protein